jgi:hypothetical protein
MARAVLPVVALLLVLVATGVRAAGTSPDAARGPLDAVTLPFPALATPATDMAAAFAAQAADCARRHDTGHPVFHGCVDWHSAVHALWALTAFQRLTGNTRHAALVDALLAPDALAREAAHLARNPRFEMPYGRAWFLRLAAERRRLHGDDRLLHLETLVANSLVDHHRATPPSPFARDYDSAAWALLGLLEHARSAGRADVAGFVVASVREHFTGDATAPLLRCRLQAETSGFLSPCLTWAWLVAEALPAAEFRAWFARWDPGLRMLAPLHEFADAHAHGLNYSRAFGMPRIAAASGDRTWLGLWARHVDAGFAPAARWRGDYAAVGHWVAQFGMLAIVPALAALPVAGPADRAGRAPRPGTAPAAMPR